MKVTFTTVPKSAAKYGMSTMGRLWKELHLQGLARRRDMQRAQRVEVTKTNKQTRELRFLFVSLKICALALYVCLPSRQLKCTLSQLLRIHTTFYETVMLIIVMWSRGCCFCCYRCCCCCCWRWKAAGPSLTKRFLFFHLTTPFFLSFPSACLLCLFQD